MLVGVIDGCEDRRRMVAGVLAKAGVPVACEADRVEAMLTNAGATQRLPAVWRTAGLICLGDILGGMDVRAACAAIRSDEGLGETPVLVLTKRREGEFLEDLLAAGATDFLIEPFTQSMLTARLGCAERLRAVVQENRQLEQQLVRALRELALARRSWERGQRLVGNG